MDEALPYAALQTYCLGVLRVATVLRFVPFFAGRPLGWAAWLALSAALGLILVPLHPFASLGGKGYLVAALGEIAVGALLGVSIRLAFSAFESAAAMVRSALLPFPLEWDSAQEPGRGPDMGVFFSLIALVCFFSLSGHHALVKVMSASMECHPLGWASGGISGFQATIEPDGLWRLMTLAVAAGLIVAAPVLTAGILAELFSGFLSRLAERPGLGLPGQWLKILATQLALAATLWLGVKVGLELLMSALDGLSSCV